MATTPKLALRYPSGNDAPDGPGAFLALATDTENALGASAAQMCHAIWASGTDQSVAPNTWTDIFFDTSLYDPSAMRNASDQKTFTVPWTGRYSLDLRAAITNDKIGARILLGIRNVSYGTEMAWAGSLGIPADTPLTLHTEEILSAGLKLKASIYIGDPNATWIRNGNGNFRTLAPQLIIRYLGPA